MPIAKLDILEVMIPMTKIYTIGTNGKTPRKFFKLLIENSIELVIDIRLNNKSQLAGFAKGGDDYLGYFLNDLFGIKYIHDQYFAPTNEILDSYHKNHDWSEYVAKFSEIIKKRDFETYFDTKYSKYNKVCFLCAEETADKCHRRLVAESIANKENIFHL